MRLGRAEEAGEATPSHQRALADKDAQYNSALAARDAQHASSPPADPLDDPHCARRHAPSAVHVQLQSASSEELAVATAVSAPAFSSATPSSKTIAWPSPQPPSPVVLVSWFYPFLTES